MEKKRIQFQFQLLICVLMIYLFTTPTRAEEVDDFNDPPITPGDATEILETATEALLSELITTLNGAPLSSCDDPRRYELALKKLDQNFTAIGNGLRSGPELQTLLSLQKKPNPGDFDQFEDIEERLQEIEDIWLAEYPAHQRHWFARLFASIEYFGFTGTKNSIYKGLDFPTCCTSRINVGGLYIGIDKIDHFFGNGGLLFEQLQLEKRAHPERPGSEHLLTIMKINDQQEHSLWGLKGLSPKSYGDMAANWQGLHFYQRLFDESHPYIECKQNTFYRASDSPFHLKDYVDEAWNESYNCSSFASLEDLHLFEKNLREQNFSCPRSPLVCDDLKRKHYTDELFINYALSPLCRDQKSAFTPIEAPIPIPWSDVELAFRGFTWPIIKDLVENKAVSTMGEWLPSFVNNQSTLEGAQVFQELLDCRQRPQAERLHCIQNLTPPRTSYDQLLKFEEILRADLSQPFSCPAEAEKIEKTIHPEGLADFSLCFKNLSRSTPEHESLGHIYFQRNGPQVKIALLKL